MNTRLICIVLLSLLSYAGLSQETSDVEDLTKVTFLNPGFAYEHKLGKHQTLHAHAFLSTSAYFFYSSSQGTDAGIDFDPAITVMYRYYYNAAKRTAKGKRTVKNSLNYIGPSFGTYYTKASLTTDILWGNEQRERRPVFEAGVVWGIQRNYPKRFSLDLNVGPGVVFGKSTIEDIFGNKQSRSDVYFTIIGGINLGFWLGKRN